MSTMSELDIFLQEAAHQIEDAARRLRVALDTLDLDPIGTGEIRAAFADLYDGGIDAVLTMRGLCEMPARSVSA